MDKNAITSYFKYTGQGHKIKVYAENYRCRLIMHKSSKKKKKDFCSWEQNFPCSMEELFPGKKN